MFTEYLGACDASAAEAVGGNLFVAANDEENLLRVYDRDTGGAPLTTFDLSPFLGTTADHPEADIEASAGVGRRIYWITSHGRNKEARPRPNRRRFFALEVAPTAGGGVSFTPVGAPYTRLLDDLLAAPALEPFGLKRAEKLAPEAAGGLNIEGLAATPTGALLIAFRNPIPDGKALLVPLENPAELLAGSSAVLGEPVVLDLGGRGVRSVTYLREQKRYVIVAGSHDDERDFALFRWDGPGAGRPKELKALVPEGLNPEAAVAYPDRPSELQLLSDDGGVKLDGQECKSLPPQKRRFRGFWIPV